MDMPARFKALDRDPRRRHLFGLRRDRGAFELGIADAGRLRSFDEFGTWSFASISTGGAIRGIGGLQSNGTVLNAEFDALTFVAVPEPQTWTMILLGFPGIGLLRLKSMAKKVAQKMPA